MFTFIFSQCQFCVFTDNILHYFSIIIEYFTLIFSCITHFIHNLVFVICVFVHELHKSVLLGSFKSLCTSSNSLVNVLLFSWNMPGKLYIHIFSFRLFSCSSFFRYYILFLLLSIDSIVFVILDQVKFCYVRIYNPRLFSSA